MSHYGHFASLMWAKLILGRFRDTVLPIFLDFLLVQTINLIYFSLTTVMRDIVVEMSQGQEEKLICLDGSLPLRGCVCAGGLMLRKQITNWVKGAEKTKRVSKRTTVMQTRKATVDLAALESEERRQRPGGEGKQPQQYLERVIKEQS